MNTKKPKKNENLIGWVKFFAIAFVVVGIFYSVFNFIPFFNSKQHFVIISNSMVPTLYIGDVVIIDKDINFDELEVDDMIAFYHEIEIHAGDEVVVHYIADIQDDGNGTVTYKTKREGVVDPLNWDNWVVTQNEIIGINVLTIPKIGSFLLFIDTFIGKLVIILNLTIIYLVIQYFKKGSKARYM